MTGTEVLGYGSVFEALNTSGGRYVIVGGLAVVLHGHTRLTTDTDLVVDLAAEPAMQLLHALEALGFRPRIPVDMMEFADVERRREWREVKGMQVFSLFHRDDPRWVIDLFADHPVDFEDLIARAEVKSVDGVDVRVASIDDLIEMKRRAGRNIDIEDIEYLKQIREIRGEYRVGT